LSKEDLLVLISDYHHVIIVGLDPAIQLLRLDVEGGLSFPRLAPGQYSCQRALLHPALVQRIRRVE
jgi:hypothetical protein